jgi:hypothetical protein
MSTTNPNTTPLTYNGYVSQIATMAVVETTTVNGVVQGVDSAFNSILPQMLNYAELRIQRDIDLLPAQALRSYSLTLGSNYLSISANDFVTVNTLAIIPDAYSSEIPLIPTSREFLQNVWGNPSSTGIPKYFSMSGGDLATFGETSMNIRVGPYPDDNYAVNVYGMVRMPTLYQFANAAQASNNSTFISTYLPDMLIMASMVYISAYQRNFGRMSDDPSMAQSYEGQYQVLLRGATVEEARKKFQASAWSSSSTPSAASPSR